MMRPGCRKQKNSFFGAPSVASANSLTAKPQRSYVPDGAVTVPSAIC